MNTGYLKKNTTVFCLAVCAVYVSPAYAYMDPGTGSLLLQGLLGGIAGAVVFIRLYWHKLVSWLGMARSSESKGESE